MQIKSYCLSCNLVIITIFLVLLRCKLISIKTLCHPWVEIGWRKGVHLNSFRRKIILYIIEVEFLWLLQLFTFLYLKLLRWKSWLHCHLLCKPHLSLIPQRLGVFPFAILLWENYNTRGVYALCYYIMNNNVRNVNEVDSLKGTLRRKC